MPPEFNDELLGDFFKLISTAKKTEEKTEVVAEAQAVPLPPPPPAPFKELKEKVESDLIGKISADLSSLNDLFKTVTEGKRVVEKQKEEEKKLEPLLGELQDVFQKPEEFVKKKKKAIVNKKEVKEETIEDVVKELPKEAQEKIVTQEVNNNDIDELEKKFKNVVKSLQNEIDTLKKSLSSVQRNVSLGSGAGSGEVNLRNLDDVDRNSIRDGRILSYSEAAKKFTFIPRPTGGGGASNIIVVQIPLNGKLFTVDSSDYNITTIYFLSVRDSNLNEVSVVSTFNGSTITLDSLVDLTGLSLVLVGE